MVIFTNNIIAWTGKGVNKLRNCENYELYGKIPICKGIEKFSSILMDQPTETGRMFDNGLFLAFVFGFFSFLIASIYTILVEDSKSLKEISNKVIRTTDTIVTVLRTMWTLKVSKDSNTTIEQELMEINRNQLFTEPGNAYASHDEMKEEMIPNKCRESENIEFVEQIEFSLNDDWHPPKDEENNPYLVDSPPLDAMPDVDENKSHKVSPCETPNHSPVLSKLQNNIPKDSDKDPNLQVLYKKRAAEAYSINSRCDEAAISHGESLRESRWSTTNSISSRQGTRNTNVANKDSKRHYSPEYHPINRQPSRMSYMSYSSRKYKSNIGDGNTSPPARGIFDQRRRDKAKARRSNSSERNCVPMTWDTMSMHSNSIKSRNLRKDKYNRENRTSITPEYSK